jgi:hypothetical protein
MEEFLPVSPVGIALRFDDDLQKQITKGGQAA